MCHCAANPGLSLCLVPDVDDLFVVLPGDRVEAGGAAVEGLVELEVLPLRPLHVFSYFLSGFLSVGLTSVQQTPCRPLFLRSRLVPALLL